MITKKNIFMSLIERVSKKAEILDDLCGIIPLEIESNKEKREDWLSWHSEWKKAWIDKDSNLSTEELEQKRILTSVTTKYPVIE
jgi:hypothetical protein